MVGTGRGAHAGVLVKDAEALQLLERVDTLVIDKTGTLTEGRPRLVDIEILAGFFPADVLAAAAAVEARSEHPLARAVLDAARDQGVETAEAADFESQTGLGVSGVVGGRTVVVGNAAQMERVGVDAAPLSFAAERHRGTGAGTMLVAIGGRLAGLLVVTDPVKEIGRPGDRRTARGRAADRHA
ncbi:MAG: HAD family hydrolase, partial [Sphingomonas sp.]